MIGIGRAGSARDARRPRTRAYGDAAGSPGTFEPRFASRVPGWLEGAVVAVVFALIAVILWLVVQNPGPLVVQVVDDARNPVIDARVRCTGPDGKEFAGLSDVFGEAKWPGLAKGAWRCDVQPPARYFADAQRGYATVIARKPATWVATFERPGRALVEVVRPERGIRAAAAVRAVCAGGESWEARAGVLDGRVTLWIPHGARCRIGLVRPELPRGAPGPVTNAKLSCDTLPCSAEISASVGQQIDVTLRPTRAQWAEARPPPEPDSP
ncbi:MAG: hypothetical protein ACJ784_10250 [Myxococcales bacterium]